MAVPADLANRALDALGLPVDQRIGDIEEGGIASVLLRHYGPGVRQLARAAHWNFSRTRVRMQMLNDATGNTTRWQQQQGYPVTVGLGTPGMRPWVYEYAWPTNCLKARFVPRTMHNNFMQGPPGNYSIPPVPPTTGFNNAAPFVRDHPARFLVGQDNIPNLVGVPETWASFPDMSQTQGQALNYQTVILTNERCADLVYTALLTDPNQWDPLFQQAFVSWLAAQCAMTLLTDRKAALAVRDEQIRVAKSALEQARITDGNEGWFSNDIVPDWLRIRNDGPGRGAFGWGDGAGILFGAWDACGFADGTAY